VQNKDGLPRLDGDYTIFGQVFKGMDVIDTIAWSKTDSLDVPVVPVKLDINIINLTAAELKKNGYVIP